MTHDKDSHTLIKLFSRLYLLIQPYHRHIYKGVLIGPVLGLISVVPPYLTKLLFDNVAYSFDINLLTVLAIGIIVFSIASILAESALQYYSNYLNIKLENVLQLLFFDHLQNLPYKFFYKRKIGEMSARFQEIKMALDSVHAFLSIIIGQGVYLIIAPLFLFYLNWKLAILAIISVPFSAFAIYLVNQRLRHSWQKVVESHTEIEATQVQMLNQILSIKSQQLEKHMYDRCSLQFTEVLGAHLHAQNLRTSLAVFEKTINVLNIGLLTWFGWFYIIGGTMSIGDYVAFIAYVSYLRMPMAQVVELISNFQQWAVHLKRVFNYLDETPEQILCSEKIDLDQPRVNFNTSIVFDKVDFQFEETNTTLSGVSLQIPKGSTTGFVGLSGSGKSTLLKIITRIEHDYQGTITIDKRDIKSIPLNSYRSLFGIAWQDADLFHGSIRENLLLGSKHCSQEKLSELIKLCSLEEFIDSQENGLDTIIAEKGNSLSSGQKQRIALVRALARSPSILVLDEALSNLDTKTETKVLNQVFDYAKSNQITILFVTHRLNTVRHCDNIFLLDQGKIVDSGNYQDLSETSDHYSRLTQIHSPDMA